MKKLIYLLLSCTVTVQVYAQDLLNELTELDSAKKEPVIATFKGTRLINLHTIETLTKGSLDFRISHRFGEINTGGENLWGLDGPATIRLGLDYSVTNNLVVGLGRTSYRQYFDGFVKYKLWQQQTGGKKFSLVGIASVNVTGEKDANKAITGIDRYANFSSRMAYMMQILVARKFSEKFSLQLAPTLVHYNLVDRANDKNDIFAIAASGRYKITRSLAITGEYIARPLKYTPVQDDYFDVLSIGLDIETGGHVFQLFFTNAFAINEVQLIPYTNSSWRDKGIRFGFNISRVFALGDQSKW
ncbi:MAG: DUF5777 family beta-barrel protein [Cyclobacteriaceae bacterium]|jgi:hypothetical protein|nr:DUF5777 family beta-barrel protein [Flammeovirgaceae bacterium]MCZ8022932.1 DUF5777 family beta-barrel protein [Cytophagales bacterium]MCZ8327308.1 DUF5777 family beta-barrel protein [Cyclobacteriaceae bacterium]